MEICGVCWLLNEILLNFSEEIYMIVKNLNIFMVIINKFYLYLERFIGFFWLYVFLYEVLCSMFCVYLIVCLNLCKLYGFFLKKEKKNNIVKKVYFIDWDY